MIPLDVARKIWQLDAPAMLPIARGVAVVSISNNTNVDGKRDVATSPNVNLPARAPEVTDKISTAPVSPLIPPTVPQACLPQPTSPSSQPRKGGEPGVILRANELPGYATGAWFATAFSDLSHSGGYGGGVLGCLMLMATPVAILGLVAYDLFQVPIGAAKIGYRVASGHRVEA